MIALLLLALVAPAARPVVDVDLDAIRRAHGVPAVAVAAVRDGEVVLDVAAGERAAGGGEAVTAEARWHAGSITKSMTAVVAASMVEDKLIRWDSTVAEVLPAEAAAGQAAFRDVTLLELLRHRGGVATNPIALITRLRELEARPADDPRGPAERRREAAAWVLTTQPGERGAFAYANAGYLLAGAMLEAAGGAAWEDLMRGRLFGPLGLESAGFGPPPGEADPLGHMPRHDGGVGGPVAAHLPFADNPPLLGPAGTVHLTAGDLARYAAAHAERPDVLGISAANWDVLHEPAPGGDYACGLIVVDRPWAGGRALTHAGSNTLWHAVIWVAPARRLAVAACANAADAAATDAAASAAVAGLTKSR